MLMASPTFNFKDEKDMDNRIKFGYQVMNGLMTSDFYIPEYDMIIEIDGPCHFFQDRFSIVEGTGDDEKFGIGMNLIRDISEYSMPKSRLKTRLKRNMCSKLVVFDF